MHHLRCKLLHILVVVELLHSFKTLCKVQQFLLEFVLLIVQIFLELLLLITRRPLSFVHGQPHLRRPCLEHIEVLDILEWQIERVPLKHVQVPSYWIDLNFYFSQVIVGLIYILLQLYKFLFVLWDVAHFLSHVFISLRNFLDVPHHNFRCFLHNCLNNFLRSLRKYFFCVFRLHLEKSTVLGVSYDFLNAIFRNYVVFQLLIDFIFVQLYEILRFSKQKLHYLNHISLH